MRDSVKGNVYDASDPGTLRHHHHHQQQQQHTEKAFYSSTTPPSSSSNLSLQSNCPSSSSSSSSSSSYDELHFSSNNTTTTTQRNPRRESSIPASNSIHHHHDLENTFSSLATLQYHQGSRHTLPANFNSSQYYHHNMLSSSHDAAEHYHRVASYPSNNNTNNNNEYPRNLSGQLHTDLFESSSSWFIKPANFESRSYRRNSTLSNSSFATSAARHSVTSFATTASTRSSLFSNNETYASPRSSLVVSNDTIGIKYEDFSSTYVAEKDDTQPTVAPPPPEISLSDPGRPFQCTYSCGKTFAKRHEWKRHEHSIHETQWKYICRPELLYPGMHCQFCHSVADQAHLELNHQNRLCQELDHKFKHTFSRKDKFQLHVHQRHCPNHKAKKQWQKWAQPTDPRSEGYGCGFCNEHLPTWNVRAKHIGDHFEKDAPRCTMERWNRSCDVGIYGHNAQSPKFNSSPLPNTDFYAESKALSDGESQAHTPPASQYNPSRHRKSSKASLYNNRRSYQEEEEVNKEEDTGAETLFGDDMDYVV